METVLKDGVKARRNEKRYGNFCLECGEPLIGRIDKKFCCDACRTSYNNYRRTAGNRRTVRIRLKRFFKLRKIEIMITFDGKPQPDIAQSARYGIITKG